MHIPRGEESREGPGQLLDAAGVGRIPLLRLDTRSEFGRVRRAESSKTLISAVLPEISA
jgi:hypothetical protein